jgi:hypothetical protein
MNVEPKKTISLNTVNQVKQASTGDLIDFIKERHEGVDNVESEVDVLEAFAEILERRARNSKKEGQ